MFTQLHSRNCPIALRQYSKSYCFGISCHRPSTRSRQQIMNRANASPDRREPIAFTGSATVHPATHTEVMQGVEPAPRPVTQQPPSVWAAGIALGLGIACAVAWRQLTGQTKNKSKRDGEWQQTDQQKAVPGGSSPMDPARNLPQPIARSVSTDNADSSDFPNSLSAMKTTPVVKRSASLEANAPAVQERSTEQRRPYKPASGAAEPAAAPKPADYSSSPAPKSSAEDPAQTETKQRQRGLSSNRLPSDTAAGVKSDDTPPAEAATSASQQSAQPSSKLSESKPSPRGFSDSAKQADASPSPLTEPAASRESAQASGKQNEAKPPPRSFLDGEKQSDAAADDICKPDASSSSQPSRKQGETKQGDAKPSQRSFSDSANRSAAAHDLPPKTDASTSTLSESATSRDPAQPSRKQIWAKPPPTGFFDDVDDDENQSNSAADGVSKADISPSSHPATKASTDSAQSSRKQSEANPPPTGFFDDDEDQSDSAADDAPQASSQPAARMSADSARPSRKQDEAKPSSGVFSDKTKQADAVADVPSKADASPSSQPATTASKDTAPLPSTGDATKSSPQGFFDESLPTSDETPSAEEAAQGSSQQRQGSSPDESKQTQSGFNLDTTGKQQETEQRSTGMPSPTGTSAPARTKSTTDGQLVYNPFLSTTDSDSATAKPVTTSASAESASSEASAERDSGSAEKDSGSAEKDLGSAERDSGSAEKGLGSGEKDSGSAEDSGCDGELKLAAGGEQAGKAGTADIDLKRENEDIHDLIAAGSRDDDDVPDAFKTFDGNLPDEPEPNVTQKGPKLFESAPKTDVSLPAPQGPQNPEGVRPKQDTAAQDLESQPLRPGEEEEDAAQLRERMQQLRQAMADKKATLAAAEAASQSPQQQQEADKQPSRRQQQQQQADQQPSQAKQQQRQDSAEANKQEGDESQTVTERKQQPERPENQPAAESDAKPRVLPRPPSGDTATIFVERPGAGDDLQSHPIEDEGEKAEQGIDLVALAAGAVLPHPEKAETGGEDAFFVCSHGRGAFGVADGVGGWNLEGVDPSRYSRLLMEHAEQAILQGQGDKEDGARDVVGIAHDTITQQGEQEGADILGSSTICLGLMRPGGLVEIANVGDSGFRILRGSEIVFASEAQQHQFNMPFQLAVPGPEQYSDTCESACVYELELQPGDVIILATDGVLDNLWDDQMARLVHQFLGAEPRSVAMAQACARLIVKTAQYNSFDPKFRSPWAVEAARVGAVPWWKRFNPEGGKVDDCTAVVVCLEPAGAVWDTDRQTVVTGGPAAVTAS